MAPAANTQTVHAFGMVLVVKPLGRAVREQVVRPDVAPLQATLAAGFVSRPPGRWLGLGQLARQVTAIEAAVGGLQHQHDHHLFSRVEPEISASHFVPEEFANRAWNRVYTRAGCASRSRDQSNRPFPAPASNRRAVAAQFAGEFWNAGIAR